MPDPNDAANATLKDVTASPNPAVAANAQEPTKPLVEPEPVSSAIKIADADALEVGRLLLESGYTKDQVNEVIQAPQALASMRYMIQNNPREFINLLQRTDPAIGDRFFEVVAQEYVDRYGKKGDAAAIKGSEGSDGKGSAATSELMEEVESLRNEVTEFRTEREKRDAAASLAQVRARYEARVDDIFSQIPKDVALTKAETKALRAQLNQELAEDASVVQRVSNGNFVDVPRRFQSILDGWSADKRAAIEAAKSARERSQGAASLEFSTGPVVLPKDFTTIGEDIWDEQPLARALEKTGGAG